MSPADPRVAGPGQRFDPEEARARAQSLVRNAHSLPCLSDAAARLLQRAQDPEVAVADVRDILSQDMVLTSRALKVANSAFYSRSRSIGSIEQAIVLLGVDAVRNIAIASSLERIARDGVVVDGFRLRDLWRHSVATGVLCQLIAARYAPDIKDEAFLSGLLHDLGMLAAVHLWPERFAEVVRRCGADDPAFEMEHYLQAEDDVLGVTHDQLGAALLEQWQLPTRVIDAVAVHHGADAARGSGSILAELVVAGDRLSRLDGADLAIERCDADGAPVSGLLGSWAELEALVVSRASEARSLMGAFAG